MSDQMNRGVLAGVLAAILLSAVSSAAAGEQPATATATAASSLSTDRAAVEWVDVKIGKVLFTSRDIVRFDWDQQIFELTREKAMDLLSRPPALKQEFGVRDREGEIYRGCFMSMASSSSYDGPTIAADFFVGTRPPLYHIAGGYPGEHGPGAKRRFDPRLKQQLQSAGVLRTIKEDEKVEPIEAVFCGWHGEALGCRATVTFFPETVQLGRDIRLVLRFAEARTPGTSPAQREREARQGIRGKFGSFPEPDRIEARITLRSSDGKSERANTVIVPVENLAEGFSSSFPFSVWPWSEPGRSVDARFKPGPAELTVSIVATRKTDKGIEQVGVWDIPPRQVQILPGLH